MFVTYESRKPEPDILEATPKAKLKTLSGHGAPNKLIHAENLLALKALLDEYANTVDLIYIDPPFATNAQFKMDNARANTISRSNAGEIAYNDTLTGPAFLEFLRQRLILLREMLAEHGSIYLHIDYKTGHYVKVIMDEVFGPDKFRNDISRIKCNPKNFNRRAYGNIKDMILFYSKSRTPIWNEPRIPFSDKDTKKLFKKVSSTGRRYTTIPLHAPGETVNGDTNKAWKGIKPPRGRHWRTAPAVLDEWEQQGLIEWSANGVPRKKIFLDEKEGKKMQDIWEFKDPQHPQYPTQKNLNLLKFIVQASSNVGDLVLDCFAGSGTTLVAAQSLHRNWIGIEQSKVAIDVARKRLDGCSDMLATVEYELLQEMQQKTTRMA